MQLDSIMRLSLPTVIFYVFAGITIISTLFVITQKNPVRSVLCLVLAFFTSAVLWLLLQAEFLALILVLVYVGAVMTLFLFVIMMLDVDIETMQARAWRYLPFALLLVALLVSFLIMALSHNTFNFSIQTATTLSNTEALGMVLYTDQVFAFELAALILLVAIIAAITLVHRHAQRSKQQDIRAQIMTRKQDRVCLVAMHAENGN